MKKSLPYLMGQHWKLTATAAACAIAAVGWAIATSEPDAPPVEYTYSAPAAPAAPVGISESDARLACMRAFQQIAKDPDKASIPYVPNMGDGRTEHFFAWGASTKHLRMRNGLGLDVAATGSCIVNIQQRKITGLTLNGETFL